MNDIFAFRKQLVENYKKFSTSFASPRSNDIAKAVRTAYDDIEHGSDISYVDGLAAYDAPIENLRALLKGGYDANQLDEAGGGRVIDHLDDVRRALFEGFGGVVLNPNAEKYHLSLKNPGN